MQVSVKFSFGPAGSLFMSSWVLCSQCFQFYRASDGDTNCDATKWDTSYNALEWDTSYDAPEWDTSYDAPEWDTSYDTRGGKINYDAYREVSNPMAEVPS
ncbi:hypothetical protein ABVT39_024924 [Epinephelus coioides]